MNKINNLYIMSLLQKLTIVLCDSLCSIFKTNLYSYCNWKINEICVVSSAIVDNGHNIDEERDVEDIDDRDIDDEDLLI